MRLHGGPEGIGSGTGKAIICYCARSSTFFDRETVVRVMAMALSKV